jgi:RimJ/RimL family protein N-acetyltransferase
MTKVRSWPPVTRTVVDGVELRGHTPADIEPFWQSIDDEVRYWQGYGQRNVDGYDWLLRMVARFPDQVPPFRLLAVVHDGRYAGSYSLTPSIGRRDRWDVELGWWLGPEARGQGLGTASLAAVLAHVHGDLGLPVARMGTGIDNVRAVRQIEANGAVPVGEGRHTLPNGRVVTARWYHHTAG